MGSARVSCRIGQLVLEPELVPSLVVTKARWELPMPQLLIILEDYMVSYTFKLLATDLIIKRQ